MISRWGCIYLGLLLLLLSIVKEETRNTFIRDVIEQTKRKLDDTTN